MVSLLWEQKMAAYNARYNNQAYVQLRAEVVMVMQLQSHERSDEFYAIMNSATDAAILVCSGTPIIEALQECVFPALATQDTAHLRVLTPIVVYLEGYRA